MKRFFLSTIIIFVFALLSAGRSSAQVTTSTCNPVFNCGVGTPTPTSNFFSWTVYSNPMVMSYEYVCNTTMADPTGAGTAITDTYKTVTGLTPNTTYYFHLRFSCGGGNFSIWHTMPAFTTPTSTGVNIAPSSEAVFSVYPNPANDKITVTVNDQNGPGVLTLTDITGKVVLTEMVETEKVAVDTHAIHAGVYIARYVDSKGSQSLKVVKQ